MKILVFSDVHGNLTSLQTLIQTQDWKTSGKRIFLGDACIGSSRPNECIELLNQLDCEKLLGNNDFYVCHHIPKEEWESFSEGKRQQALYMQRIVTDQNKQIALSWKKDLMLEIEGKEFYFTHYPWEICNGEENVVDNPPAKTFEFRKQMFQFVRADYVFFGHEHADDVQTDGKQRFQCVGSLGVLSPGSYVMIDIDKHKVSVNLKKIEFDMNHEIDLIEQAGYPYNKNKIKRS